MNSLRLRILILMLFIGLAPLTALIAGLRFLPGGLLPWLYYGVIACITIALALAASGSASRPMNDTLSSFVTLFRTNGKHKPTTWVPAEYYAMQESLSRLLADNGTRVADIERTLASQARALADAEGAAIRSIEVLHTVVDNSPEGIVFMHTDGHLAMINNRAVELLGISSAYTALGFNALSWVEHLATLFEDSSELESTLRTWQKTPSGLCELDAELVGPTSRNITIRSVEVRRESTAILGRLWLFRDNTDTRRATQRLQTSQKMESIGHLAGGIAHDFNNLLTAIRGNLTMASLVEDKKDYQDKLQGATRATVRAAELVKQLLGYSRQNAESKTITDISHIVTETRSMLRASIDPRIVIRTNVAPEIWQACADPVQLEQVMLNICLNARDAMPETGGIIDISAFNIAAKSDAKPGDRNACAQVTLRIRDNGSGIPADIRDKIFDPYFTTKSADKGTGLGLAMARAIIEENGGHIEFDSEIGKGTEFRLYFPANVVAKSTAPEIPEAATRPTRDSRSGTLLIVDDEAPVRSIATQMLKYLGYTIIEASDGVEAIAKLSSATTPIDAILLDVYMPKLSGRETYKTIRERGFNTPVIVCSGFTVEPEEFTALSPNYRGSAVQVIQKPYSMESLAKVVSRAVDSREKAALAA